MFHFGAVFLETVASSLSFWGCDVCLCLDFTVFGQVHSIFLYYQLTLKGFYHRGSQSYTVLPIWSAHTCCKCGTFQRDNSAVLEVARQVLSSSWQASYKKRVEKKGTKRSLINDVQQFEVGKWPSEIVFTFQNIPTSIYSVTFILCVCKVTVRAAP